MDHNPVDWYEGMFLRPQHFQTQERYRKRGLRQNIDFSVPYAWGLRHLEIDEDALRNGRLLVRQLQARFRSGTVLDIPIDRSLDPIAIRPVLDQSGEVEIHIAIPLNLASAGDPIAEGRNRYQQIEMLVPDEHDRQLQPIMVNQIQPFLIAKHLLGEGYESLPVVRLRRSSSSPEAMEIVQTFIPPILCSNASQVLKQHIIESLSDIINRKLDALSVSLENSSSTNASQIFSDLATFNRLSLLNQTSAIISVLANTYDMSPIWIYRNLCDMIGRLAILGISRNRVVGQLPRYDHEELGQVFFALKRRIQELLETLENPGFLERSFVGVASRMQVSLEPNWLEPGWTMLIGIRSDLDPQNAMKLLANSGPLDFKISSSERVDLLYRMGQRGLHFEPIQRVPIVLKNISNTVFLGLGRDEATTEWASVRRSLNLAIRFNESLLTGSIHDQTRLQLRFDGRPIQMEMTLFAIPPQDQTVQIQPGSNFNAPTVFESGSGSA